MRRGGRDEEWLLGRPLLLEFGVKLLEVLNSEKIMGKEVIQNNPMV